MSNQSVVTSEIEANGLAFTCRQLGDGGEPVMLLHGFPETSHMWLPLMEALAEAGYRCLAPDQRGYSRGARPEGIEAYRYDRLAADIVALADAAGFGQFHLVGHDHGAGVGWMVTYTYPERVRSWTAMSVPHIAAFGRAIREDADQSERSQYIGVFQMVGQAEELLSADGFAALKQVWSESSSEEIEEYLAVLSEPGALTGALNWYRGSLADDEHNAALAVGEIATPTLCLWGNEDQAIGRKSTEWAAEYMKGPYRFVEMDAGHWLIQEKPGQVIEEILAHLAANPIATRAVG